MLLCWSSWALWFWFWFCLCALGLEHASKVRWDHPLCVKVLDTPWQPRLTRLGWIELCCASKRPLLFVADVSPPASNTPAWIPTPDEKSRRMNPLRYRCWCTWTSRCASFHPLCFCFCLSSFLSVVFLLPSSHLLTYLKTLHLQRQPRPNNVLTNIAKKYLLRLSWGIFIVLGQDTWHHTHTSGHLSGLSTLLLSESSSLLEFSPKKTASLLHK